MRNTKSLHFRTGHSMAFSSKCTPSVSILNPLTGEMRNIVCVISCDQYFSEEHNLRHGHISTSPELAADVNSVGHFDPSTQTHVLPKDMSLNDAFDTIISKDCQSFADLDRVKLSKPSQRLFEDVDDLDSKDNSVNSNTD